MVEFPDESTQNARSGLSALSRADRRQGVSLLGERPARRVHRGGVEPVACPTLDTTAVPLLHPSYQEVWLARLELTRTEYVDRLAYRLDDL